MGEHIQTGIVAVASVDAYEADLIKKHEFTRPDKEDDRVRHMDALGAQVGPVFVTYEAQAQVDVLVAEIVLSDPDYDFQAEDGTHHTFWSIQDEESIAALETAINDLDCLYVADGHHRSAAASRVRNLHRDRNPEHSGEESYNYFLVVLFPHDQMQILDYNRIIKDFGDKTAQAFLAELGANFVIKPVGSADEAKPLSPQQFGLYLKINGTTLCSAISGDPGLTKAIPWIRWMLVSCSRPCSGPFWESMTREPTNGLILWRNSRSRRAGEEGGFWKLAGSYRAVSDVH